MDKFPSGNTQVNKEAASIGHILWQKNGQASQWKWTCFLAEIDVSQWKPTGKQVNCTSHTNLSRKKTKKTKQMSGNGHTDGETLHKGSRTVKTMSAVVATRRPHPLYKQPKFVRTSCQLMQRHTTKPFKTEHTFSKVTPDTI